ncbi:MAG: chromosome partitioning protein ParA, partial [Muribaculaceae bacterium]|nr:chromosome partitioning protein ParA [Muribaculaceae bacterium]
MTDIIYRTLHYWPWVLLSLFVCVGAGMVYLLRTPNVYTTTASILIKDDASGKSMGVEDFGDFGLFKNKTNIQNEISTLKSADLMEEVVRRLNLDINYYLPGRFHRTVAYGSTLPLKVDMPDFPESGSVSFSLEADKDGNISVRHLKSSGIESGKTFSGRLGDTIRTAIGPMVVTPTADYRAGEIIDLTVEKAPVTATAGGYGARLAVAMNNDKSTVINLSITDQSTQRAQEVLNTLIGVYNEYWIRDRNRIAVSTSNFINDRLDVIESELGHVDSD